MIKIIDMMKNAKPNTANWTSRFDHWNLPISNPAIIGTAINNVRLLTRTNISSHSFEPSLFLLSLWTRSSGLSLYWTAVLTIYCAKEAPKNIHGRSSLMWPAEMKKIVICIVSSKQMRNSCLNPALLNSLSLLSALSDLTFVHHHGSSLLRLLNIFSKRACLCLVKELKHKEYPRGALEKTPLLRRARNDDGSTETHDKKLSVHSCLVCRLYAVYCTRLM